MQNYKGYIFVGTYISSKSTKRYLDRIYNYFRAVVTLG